MKVICNRDNRLCLTKDKIYDVLDTGHIGGIPVYIIL